MSPMKLLLTRYLAFFLEDSRLTNIMQTAFNALLVIYCLVLLLSPYLGFIWVGKTNDVTKPRACALIPKCATTALLLSMARILRRLMKLIGRKKATAIICR